MRKSIRRRIFRFLFSSSTIVSFRIRKTEMIIKMLTDFEQGLESTRTWMDTVETNLQRPFALNILNANELRNQQQNLLVRRSFFFFRLDFNEVFLFVFRPLKQISINIVQLSVIFLLLVTIYSMKPMFVHEISNQFLERFIRSNNVGFFSKIFYANENLSTSPKFLINFHFHFFSFVI